MNTFLIGYWWYRNGLDSFKKSGMPYKYCVVVFFLLILFLHPELYSKSVPDKFTRLNVTHGLAHNSVSSIGQDKYGFMWFGTFDGLSRYDSRNFVNFRHNPAVKGSVSSSNIRNIFRDSKDNLWIGTNHGLNLFNPVTNTFDHFFYDKHTKTANFIWFITEDSDGFIWTATNSGVVKWTDQKEKKFVRYLHSEPDGEYSIRKIVEDKEGNLWLAGNQGLIRMARDGKILARYLKPETGRQGLLNNNVKAIAIDSKRKIWIGYIDGSISVFDPGTEQFSHLTIADDPDRSYEIYRIVNGPDGAIWISSQDGIKRYDTQSLEVTHLVHRPYAPEGLGDNVVFDIFHDSIGNMWAGTYNTGINYQDKERYRFGSIGINEGLTGNMVTNLAIDEKDNLWMVVEDWALFSFHLKTRQLREETFFRKKSITALYADKRGDVWVATKTGLYKKERNSWKLIYNPGKDNTDGYICGIIVDYKNSVWITTLSTLEVLDPDTGAFRVVKKWDKPYNFVILNEDVNKRLWLVRWQEIFQIQENGQLQKISYELPGILGNIEAVTSLKEDRKGDIWIGGYNIEFQKFNAEKGYFEKGLPHKLPSTVTFEFDSLGRMWLGTVNYLRMLDTRDFSLLQYGSHDGIEANEFALMGSEQDAEGNLYFATNQGVLFFNPATITKNPFPPKTYFTKLEVNNKAIEAGDESGILAQNLLFTPEITLNHQDNFIQIGFSSLSYAQSAKNTYAYKFDKINADWNYTSEPVVSLNNLAPGKYTLLVRGANNDHVWEENPARLEIEILPSIWQSWWAYMLYCILLVVIIIVVNQFFWRQAALRNKLALNQTKMDFFTNVSHEIRTHLTLITNPIDKLMELSEDNLEVMKYLKLAKKNSKHLLSLVTELLDFRKLEDGKIELQLRSLNLVGFINNILPVFEHLYEEKKLKVTLNASAEEIRIPGDPYQLEKVFFNLLSNAYKFGKENGNILIDIIDKDQEVEVSVTDDGIGISLEHLEHLFVNFFQVNNADDKNTGYGIGLALSRKIIELHKGTIKAETVEGAGNQRLTSFVIKLPKADAYMPEPVPEKGYDVIAKTDVFSVNEENIVSMTKEESLGRFTILIAEDNDELRSFLSECLDSYVVIECRNGSEALDQCREMMPDLVISDIMMPGLDGLELCRIIKSDALLCHIPVILLTAKATETHILEGLNAHADHYMVKPFNISELQLRVHNLLRMMELQRERVRKSQYPDDVLNAPINTADKDLMTSMIKIITGNLGNPDFGVDQLARETGMSRVILYKKLKALTGMTVNDFIKKIRFSKAADLLQTNLYTVSEVSDMVGFSDRRYFSKEFRKVYGKTPADYARLFK